MNMISKSAAIAFTVLALGASAQAQSQGGSKSGGGNAGGAEPAGVMLAAGAPMTHAVAREHGRRGERRVRSIPIYNCGEGISISSGKMCQPVLR